MVAIPVRTGVGPPPTTTGSRYDKAPTKICATDAAPMTGIH